MRLALGLGFLTLFMIGLILLGILSMGYVDKQMEYIVDINNRKIWFANMLRDAMHTLDKSTLTIILSRDETVRGLESVRMLTGRATAKAALQELEKLEAAEKGKEILRRLTSSLATAGKYNEFTVDTVLAGRPDEALAYYMNTERPAVLDLQQVCTELVTYEKDQSDLRYREAVVMYTRTRNTFLVVGMLAILSGGILAFCLARSITKPLAAGVAIANRLAEGDFAVEIDEKSRDETGLLLAAMKNMAEKLKQVKSLEQQLLQSQKLENVGRLAGGVAHDFNNLLTVIKGFSELSLMDLRDDDPVKANVLAILRASIKAADLTRQLLAFSRRQVMEMKVVDLNALIQDFEKMLRRVLSEDIELRIVAARNLGKVRVDPGQIEQVILNLVVNAKDAMPSGGRLTIETENVELDEAYCSAHIAARPGPHILLSVSDTGTGMTPDVKARVFEPFFTTKEVGRGTGLGLATVYGIVKQSNGYIWVYSEAGHGTSFKIYLPRTEAQCEPMMHQDESGFLLRGNETVFLVEDESSVRDLAARILRDQGYTVFEAGDGTEALQMVEANRTPRIDLLLTDVIMPRKGGRELAEKLKSVYPEVRVIFTSGYPDDAIAHQGMPGNGIAFLPKPFTSTSLCRKVREVLDGKAQDGTTVLSADSDCGC
jgi:signal transduction histidine kinase/ActR/RegA family two-component response regulator